MIPNEVFISHSNLDQSFANSIAKVLHHHRIPFWFSQSNIIGAQQWHDEIGAALQRCDWFALILSPNSTESLWVKRELLYALQQKRFENRIIPLLYQPCDYNLLSWTLSCFQFVDFTGNFDQGCIDLMRVWDMNYWR